MSSEPPRESLDRSARINMRITPEALETIRDAARAQQQDVTSFVLGAAMERARTILAEERVLRLTPAQMAQVEAALDAEPRPIPELVALIREVRGNKTGADITRKERVAP